jgi:Flp pilus assembly secretin CpaC
MLWWCIGAALAGELTLGEGRAAVLTLDDAPTGLTISRPSVLDVVAAPPHLVVLAKKAGTATLTVDHAGGTHTWSVNVSSDSTRDPSGSPGLQTERTTVPLMRSQGVLLTLEHTPTADTVIDPARVQLQAIRDDTFYVQADGRDGVTDLVFERGRDVPRVVSIVVSELGGKLPDGVTAATEVVEVPAGGTRTLTLDGKVLKVLVGHPSRLSAERVAPDQLALTSLRSGETTLVVDLGSTRPVWLRRVVMTSPSGQ